MNPAVADVVIATVVVLCAGIAFTMWRFRAGAAHDRASTRLLMRFFDDKACAICKRPIPHVHRTGLKPGLLNPTTREIRSWDDIPDSDLPTLLETHLPVCSECEVSESFRQRYPDLVVDRDRSSPDGHAPDRVEANSSNA